MLTEKYSTYISSYHILIKLSVHCEFTNPTKNYSIHHMKSKHGNAWPPALSAHHLEWTWVHVSIWDTLPFFKPLCVTSPQSYRDVYGVHTLWGHLYIVLDIVLIPQILTRNSSAIIYYQFLKSYLSHNIQLHTNDLWVCHPAETEAMQCEIESCDQMSGIW